MLQRKMWFLWFGVVYNQGGGLKSFHWSSWQSSRGDRRRWQEVISSIVRCHDCTVNSSEPPRLMGVTLPVLLVRQIPPVSIRIFTMLVRWTVITSKFLSDSSTFLLKNSSVRFFLEDKSEGTVLSEFHSYFEFQQYPQDWELTYKISMENWFLYHSRFWKLSDSWSDHTCKIYQVIDGT